MTRLWQLLYDPQVTQLSSEIERLNKRLSQERLNLDKASKAFRRKEVAARKKSEETQELAADAHRNLEHALPSLDAAMQVESKEALTVFRTQRLSARRTVNLLTETNNCLSKGHFLSWALCRNYDVQYFEFQLSFYNYSV